MRLLRRKSDVDFDLVAFNTDNHPPYAILSHTWVDGQEVTYDELLAGTGKNKTGYDKIRFCGERAAQDGLEYFWVDTCCMDKRSSSELQEAINSMFKWYSKATICYVYLDDVTDASSVEGEESQFRTARWHSRGWTLQELLAPRNVNFYSHDRTFIGTKDTLCRQLSDITRIHVDILRGDVPISTASVAQRMSWASWRETSRSEDVAYCLMGIFSVNMTMLYGEGEKAFLRLQEEICKESNDNSIFAWQNVDRVEAGRAGYGLLATHPRHFRDSWAVSSEERMFDRENLVFIAQTPLAIVNQGIQMKSYLLTLRSSRPEIQILVLRCRLITPSDADKRHLGILVQKRRLSGWGHVYVRLRSDALTLSKHRPHLTQKTMLAKTGVFSDGAYDALQDLQTSRYELGPVQPEIRGRLSLGVAPVYLSQGSLAYWRVVAWTALHRLYHPIEARKRKHLGRIAFHREDGKQCMIQLAIRREIRAVRLFPVESTIYVGEVSWVQESGLESWSPQSRRTDCGEEHMVWVYADDLVDTVAQKLCLSYMDFTFLIRVRPSKPWPFNS